MLMTTFPEHFHSVPITDHNEGYNNPIDVIFTNSKISIYCYIHRWYMSREIFGSASVFHPTFTIEIYG